MVPSAFAPVKTGDFTLRPFPVFKLYRLDSVDVTSTASGYFVGDAVHQMKPVPIYTSKASNDLTNSFDGGYQSTLWKSLDARYYRYPYNPQATFEHSNRRWTYKFLNYSASIFSAPYLDYGEKIKPGSVIVSNSSHAFVLRDDVDGNLYDISVETGSFANRHNVLGYWGFNDTFRNFSLRSGTMNAGTVAYSSNVYEVDDNASARNVTFDTGVPINNSGSGMQAHFHGTSYIIATNNDHFNFTVDDNFTLSFWMRTPATQSVVTHTTNTMISKRGAIQKDVLGVNPKLFNSTVIYTKHISSSMHDELTDVYPFDVDIYNTGSDRGKVRFRRSNGIDILSLVTTSSVDDGNYHHIAVTKDGETVTLYLDGVEHASGTDRLDDPINKHTIMFGSVDRNFTQAYSGSLDEIRFYDYAVPAAGIVTLADNVTGSMYQTAVAGNVFYRQGNIVISPLNPKYTNALKDTWSVYYRGTHTVYQYECLVRVKKGSFNTTQNVTARKSYKSDLLIDTFASGSQNAYFTSVGLYNDRGELMVIAKVGQPIEVRSDTDINLLIRWDV